MMAQPGTTAKTAVWFSWEQFPIPPVPMIVYCRSRANTAVSNSWYSWRSALLSAHYKGLSSTWCYPYRWLWYWQDRWFQKRITAPVGAVTLSCLVTPYRTSRLVDAIIIFASCSDWYASSGLHDFFFLVFLLIIFILWFRWLFWTRTPPYRLW